MNQNQQHRAQTAQSYYNQSKKYKAPYLLKPGKYSNMTLRNYEYTQNDARNGTKMTKKQQAHQKERRNLKSRRAHGGIDWIQEKTRVGYTNTLPDRQRTNKTNRTRMGNKTGKWGTKEEVARLDDNWKKREKLKKQINTHTEKIRITRLAD